MSTIKLPLYDHTLYLLIGPTGSGKSTFCQIASKAVADIGLSCKTLSSDQFRQELTGLSSLEEKYSPMFRAASKQAFALLDASLVACMSQPICTTAIFVDTTGMSDDFRKGVLEKAKHYHYRVVAVMFDYKDHNDYFSEYNLSLPDGRDIVTNSVKRFREKVLPTVRASDFEDRVRIKVKDAWEIKLAPELLIGFECRIYPLSGNALVIGDLHECHEELQELLQLASTKYPGGYSTFLLGDYLDKGGATEATVNLVHKLVMEESVWMIRGNHENYVRRRLNKSLLPSPDKLAMEVEGGPFSSLAVLSQRPDLAEKVEEVWEKSLDFVQLLPSYPSGMHTFLTHSPCRMEELGKTTSLALSAQRNYRRASLGKSSVEELSWLYGRDQADSSLPLHVFGHISHFVSEKDVYRNVRWGNRVFADGNCVNGGDLLGMVICNGQLVEVLRVPSKRPRPEAPEGREADYDMGKDPRSKVFNEADYELSPLEERLLHKIGRDGIKFISPTMSPGPSSWEWGSGRADGEEQRDAMFEIEPLIPALKMFLKKGIEQVVLEPKYMGSRAQAYFFKDEPQKTFLVSRSGWKVSNIHLPGGEQLREESLQAWLETQYHIREDLISKLGTCILDCELEPWQALGHHMIRKQFTAYGAVIEANLSLASQALGPMTPEGMIKRLGVSSRTGHLSVFHEVLARFAQERQPELKPFDILALENTKAVNMGSTEARFVGAGGVGHLVLDLTQDGWEALATSYFQGLTTGLGMEGLVIKPLDTSRDEIPFLKVRSEEYLRLVYGYDWPMRTRALVTGKRIGRKLDLSRKEVALGKAMLTAQSPKKVREAAVQMVAALRNESGLDPRL